MMSEEFLDVSEVATLLKLRPVTIYRWCRAGRLAGIKVGKEWRIPRSTVMALLRASGWERNPDHAYPERVHEEEPMNEISPASEALARRLLRHEAGEHPETAAIIAAAGRIQQWLAGRLTGVIGVIGFATLFARARHLAQMTFPTLAQLDFEQEATVHLATSNETAESAAIAAGVIALFANFIELLSTFIGDDLTLRLIRDAWPQGEVEVFDHVGTEGEA